MAVVSKFYDWLWRDRHCLKLQFAWEMPAQQEAWMPWAPAPYAASGRNQAVDEPWPVFRWDVSNNVHRPVNVDRIGLELRNGARLVAPPKPAPHEEPSLPHILRDEETVQFRRLVADLEAEIRKTDAVDNPVDIRPYVHVPGTLEKYYCTGWWVLDADTHKAWQKKHGKPGEV